MVENAGYPVPGFDPPTLPAGIEKVAVDRFGELACPRHPDAVLEPLSAHEWTCSYSNHRVREPE